MASLNDFDGVEEAIQQQQGAVYNLPPGYNTPSSQSTTAAIDIWETPNYVPPGNFSAYNQSFNPDVLQLASTGTVDQNAFTPAYNPGPNTEVPEPEKTPNQDYTVDIYGVPLPQQVLPNPLHDFENYTYNLSLHAITTQEFNNLAENPDGYIPNNVLIAGAGKYSDNFKRNVHFQEDFYFDDFKMRTIVNTTQRTKFSNVVELSFKIIEPNGFTLIQRLITACESPPSEGGVGGQNYLKQPFLLQIDFYGQKDGEIGTGIIPDQTKIIPIRLVGMKTKIGVQGTEYTVEATPFNHTAFDPRYIVMPAAFTIKAATVNDIFQNSNVDQSVVDAETQRYRTEQEENARLQSYANLADAFGPGTQSQTVPQSTTVLGQYGIAAAYNSWHRTLERKSLNGTTYKPNLIKFVIDPEIANSRLYVDGPNDISNAASRDDAKTNAQQAGGINKGQIQFNAGTITMPAGTSIQSVVKWAIANSDYVRKQLIGVDTGDPRSSRQTQLQDPFKFVKIVPRVRIISYDQSRQDYQYEITYYIRKYTMNSRSPNAPQGRVKGWVKEYNWIYTGGQSPYTTENLSNKDVIDLQLDFNMLFYTALTAFRDKNKLFNTGKFVGDADASLAVESSGFEGDPNNPKPVVDSQEAPPDAGAQDRIARASTHYWSGSQDSHRTGAQQAAVNAAGDVIRNTQLEARGDMINVKLTILGDPQFIKQDDIFYNLGIGNKSSLLTPNNSLFMDDGELYVFVNFRSPVDYDEETGLAIPFANRYSYSEFTGVYKIITIENSFTRGRFQQVLDLVRLSIDDSKRVLAVQQAFRQQNAQEVGQGQLARFPTTGVLGQRIATTVFSGGLLAGGAQGLINSLAGQVFREIQQETANIVQDLGTDLIEGISDVVTDIGQSLGLIDTAPEITAIFDPEVGDPSLFNTIPKINVADYDGLWP